MKKLFSIATLLLVFAAVAVAQIDDRALFDLHGDVGKCSPQINDWHNPWLTCHVEFDNKGHITMIDGLEPLEGQIKHDKKGRITEITIYQDDAESITRFTYNDKDQVVKEEYIYQDLDSPEEKLGSAVLTYNDEGLVKHRKITMEDASQNDEVSYEYSHFSGDGNWENRVAKSKLNGTTEESREITYGAAEAKEEATEVQEDKPVDQSYDNALDKAAKNKKSHKMTAKDVGKALLVLIPWFGILGWCGYDIWRKLKHTPMPVKRLTPEFAVMRNGNLFTDEEREQVVQLLADIENGCEQYISSNGEECWTPTTRKQVDMMKEKVAQIEALAPTDEDLVQGYNDMVDQIERAEKRYFSGGKMYLIVSTICSVVGGMALGPVGWVLLVSGCVLYYFASLRPQFMGWHDDLKGKKESSCMNAMLGSAFAVTATAKTYKTVTTWSDGSKTTDTDHSEVWAGCVVTFIMTILLALLCTIIALVNYLRNYVFYK